MRSPQIDRLVKLQMVWRIRDVSIELGFPDLRAMDKFRDILPVWNNNLNRVLRPFGGVVLIQASPQPVCFDPYNRIFFGVKTWRALECLNSYRVFLYLVRLAFKISLAYISEETD